MNYLKPRWNLFGIQLSYFDITIFVINLFIFILIVLNLKTDIPVHLSFVKEYIEGTKPSFPTNFLLYGLIYIASFITQKTTFLLLVLVSILALSNFIKYYIVKHFLKEHIDWDNSNQQIKWSTLVATSLIFVFSIPVGLFLSKSYYLGYFPANVWHNSTTIFVMPFAITLFLLSIQQLQHYSSKRFWWILVFILLNAFAKPSYLFIYFIVFPLFALYKYKLTPIFFKQIAPIFVGVIFVLIEYLLIYQLNPTNSDDGVTIHFLFFYREELISASHPILQLTVFLMGSYLFPALLILKNPGILKNSFYLQFAVISVIVGLAIFYTFIETGPRMNHGNFIWQVYIATFILFFISAFELLKLFIKPNGGFKKYRLEIFTFFIYAISGIIYIILMILNKSYF